MTLILLVLGCQSPQSLDLCEPSSGGILLAPTPQRATDPDLFRSGTGKRSLPAGHCSNPETETSPELVVPTQQVVTEVLNLSLDIDDQVLADTAVGDDRLAVAWLSGSEAIVALSRGGIRFQIRPVDQAEGVSLVFSPANRLHMAYEQNGRIAYRAADQGTHPADTLFSTLVADGSAPQLALDDRLWAHILYEHAGQVWHAYHLYEFIWVSNPLGSGNMPSVAAFPPNEDQLQFITAYQNAQTIETAVFGQTLLGEPGWVFRSGIPLETPPVGPIQMTTAVDAQGQIWIAASWITQLPHAPSATEPESSDPFQVMTSWSTDAGRSWTLPVAVAQNHTAELGWSGKLGTVAYPLRLLTAEPPSLSFLFVYEAGDPPPDSTFMRFGRPMIVTCPLDGTTCLDAPVEPVLPRQLVRPVTNLSVSADPFNPQRFFLAWDGWQADLTSRDLFVSMLTWR